MVLDSSLHPFKNPDLGRAPSGGRGRQTIPDPLGAMWVTRDLKTERKSSIPSLELWQRKPLVTSLSVNMCEPLLKLTHAHHKNRCWGPGCHIMSKADLLQADVTVLSIGGGGGWIFFSTKNHSSTRSAAGRPIWSHQAELQQHTNIDRSLCVLPRWGYVPIF